MTVRLGLFRLAGRGFAVPLSRLLRVVDHGLAVPLPLVPAGVAGMLVIDTELVPLFDSDWLVGVAPGLSLACGYRVLVATEYGAAAFPADMTIGIVSDAKGERRPASETSAYLVDDFFYRDGIYHVLDVDLFIMSLIRS